MMFFHDLRLCLTGTAAEDVFHSVILYSADEEFNKQMKGETVMWIGIALFIIVAGAIARFVNPNVVDEDGKTDFFQLWGTILMLGCYFLGFCGIIYGIYVVFLICYQVDDVVGQMVAIIAFLGGIFPMFCACKAKFK